MRQRAAEVLHAIAVDAAGQLSLQEAVDQVIAAIRTTKEPILQKYLWLILVPFLFMLVNVCLTPVADFKIKQYLEASSKQPTKKIINEAARETIGDIRLLRHYRFVTAQQLAVRSAAGVRSPAFGQLHIGQVVRILQKDGSFTLVSWRSEDGEAELQGWVFSRYLKRFD